MGAEPQEVTWAPQEAGASSLQASSISTGMLGAPITCPPWGRNVAWATGSQKPGRRGGERPPSAFWNSPGLASDPGLLLPTPTTE